MPALPRPGLRPPAGGALLSTLGGAFTAVAYPLLILGLTGSPAKAGLVSAARIVGAPLLILPAGIAADRLDRRWIMLAADAVRALAVGSIALLVALHPVFWPLPILAFVEGAGEAFFAACSGGALRSVVPPDRLPEAISVQTGRTASSGSPARPSAARSSASAAPSRSPPTPPPTSSRSPRSPRCARRSRSTASQKRGASASGSPRAWRF